MTRIKCTPFCKHNCSQKHHDLLLAILNIPSDGKGNKKNDVSGGLEELEACVQNFLKKGWKKDDVVPDAEEDYQFPLVHWASVLGKLKALEWLILNGFDTTVRAPKTKETALHRCLLCLEVTLVSLPRKALEQKMEALIDLLKNCLLLRNSDMETPLHVAAKQLLEGRNKDHFEHCIKLMLIKIKECFSSQLHEILNAQNNEGDTVVHILANCEYGFFSLRTMINEGAITSVTNVQGKTPLDVAMESKSSRSTALLKKVANERMSDTDDNEMDLNQVIDFTDQEVKTQIPCTLMIKKENENHVQNSQVQSSTDTSSNTDQNSSDILDLLSGAGLWNTVKELASKKKKEDEKSLTVKLEELKAIVEAIEDAKKVVNDTEAKINIKTKELENLKKELEGNKTELNYIKNEHKELVRKQNVLNTECIELQKQLHYCDSLLKVYKPQIPDPSS